MSHGEVAYIFAMAREGAVIGLCFVTCYSLRCICAALEKILEKIADK